MRRKIAAIALTVGSALLVLVVLWLKAPEEGPDPCAELSLGQQANRDLREECRQLREFERTTRSLREWGRSRHSKP